MPQPTRILLPWLTLALAVPLHCLAEDPSIDTTIVLVRHAEKDRSNPTDNDPRLTEEGHARAQALVHTLGNAGIDSVYSTPYRRTRDTARPLAKHLGIGLERAPVGNHAKGMAKRIRDRHAGQTVLVVGHSNTTPELARALGIASPPVIEDHVYDQLWVIKLPADTDSAPSLLRLRYGAPTSEEEGEESGEGGASNPAS
ncbi:MAG: histidine phosphatase family protein [Thermoanaerobaculia bacterium]|nr:histidine phosphatase family protein [Thermoanaerobaculia bacterium]